MCGNWCITSPKLPPTIRISFDPSYFMPAVTQMRQASWLPFLHKITVFISEPPQRSWWGMILGENVSCTVRNSVLHLGLYPGRRGSLITHATCNNLPCQSLKMAQIRWFNNPCMESLWCGFNLCLLMYDRVQSWLRLQLLVLCLRR